MEIVNWDAALRPQEVSFNLRGQTIIGGASLTGRTQVALMDAGYWVARFGGIVVNTRARVLAYRAMAAILRGGATAVRLPAKSCSQSPWVSGVTSQEGVTYSDGTTHSDGTGYFQPVIDVELSAAAAAGDSTIDVTILNAGEILPGMFFSLGDHLHVLRQVLSSAGGDETWAISPRVREDLPAGAWVNFEDPVCLMRLMDETVADLSLVAGRVDTPDVSFVEVIP